jgi:O-antigen/teichoic acid export membrane protein
MLSKALGSVIYINFIIVLLGGMIVYLFRDMFYGMLVQNISLKFILLSILLIISTPMYSIYIKLLRIQEKANKFVIISFLNISLQIIFILTFVVYMKLGALGYILSLSLSMFMLASFSFYEILKNNKLSFDKKIAIEALQYSSKIVPHTFSSWGLSSFTILVIGWYLGSEEVGFYSIVYYLSIIVSVLADALLYTYQPWLYKILESKDNIKLLFIETITLFNLIFILIAFFLSLFSDEIIKLLFSKNYYANTNIAPILIYSRVVLFTGSLHTYVLYYYKHATKEIAKATMIGVLLNVATSLLLIPKFGLFGAAISLFIAQVVIAIIKQYYSLNTLKITENLYKVYLLIIANIAISSYIVSTQWSWEARAMVFLLESILLYLIYKKIFDDFFVKILKGYGK